MEKKIKDGCVAVLYSVGYGSGWYSWHYVEELLYDPVIVDMVGDQTVVAGELADKITKYCEEKYGWHNYYGVVGLTVGWVPQGEEFMVLDYDGAESIALKKKFKFLTA